MSVWRVSLVALLVFHQPATTAVIVVGGGCSLADAITAATSDVAVGGCSAGSGADELQLTEDVTLTTRLPSIFGEVAIEGGGFTVARDDTAPDFGIFLLFNSTFSLLNTTVANGLAANGGAIDAYDSIVTIINSTLTGNQATGQTVPIPLSTTTWDCVAEGLVVNFGDRIEQQVGGTVP